MDPIRVFVSPSSKELPEAAVPGNFVRRRRLSDELNNDGGDGVQNADDSSRQFRMFCHEVSIVGMRYVVQGPNLRRNFWILLMLFGAGFTIYQVQERIKFYLSWPSNVNVDVDFVRTMRFPTVTICNENRIKKKTLNQLGDVLPSMISQMFPPLPTAPFKPDPNSNINLATGATNWTEVYLYVAQSRQDAIIGCTFGSNSCDKVKDFVVTPTNIGYCFSFNSASFNYTSNQPGSNTGLYMTLFVDQDNYIVTSSASAGFRVLLTDVGETPQVQEKGFKISAGHMTQVSVSATRTIALPDPYSDCKDDDNYSQTTCLLQCLTNYSVNICHCRDIYMPETNGSTPLCGPWDLYTCLFPANSQFVEKNEAGKCNCPRQCRKVTYEYTISQAEFSEYVMSWLQASTNISIYDIRRNYAILSVFFSDLQYTTYEWTPAYTFLALLCDVGGALGLVLGSTILTLVEVIDFCAMLAIGRVALSRLGKRKQRVTDSRDQVKISAAPNGDATKAGINLQLK